jgi:hypothetical protein
VAIAVVFACLPSARVAGQWAAEPTVDPFQQRAAQSQGVRTGAPPDIDPLPPLNAGPRSGSYPSVAAVPQSANPAATYPSATYLPGSYPANASSNQTAPGGPLILPGPSPMPGEAYPPVLPQQPMQPISEVPPTSNYIQGGQTLVPGTPSPATRFLDHLEGNAVIRGYYRNDQRINWSGMEETFGAEADLTPRLRYCSGDFEFIVDSEFWINQPYERNPLLTPPERRSYLADFQVNQFDIGKLALVTNYDGCTFKIGKFETPFGRAYYPIYTNPYLYPNQAMDQPYIRTEIIENRETGILAHYKSGYFTGDIAFTNGGDNLDTNSSKALIARIGFESENWAFGASAKKEDGDGSEEIKEFGTYYGIDLMFRAKPFTLSAECIYDEYGFGRPGFDPNQIYWNKSIYYRDVSSGKQGVPCTGVGYYVDLDYADGRWDATLDYGEFYPLFIGTAPNQRVERRGLIKVAYRWAEPLQSYTIVILENDGYPAQLGYARSGVAFVQGFQFTF